LDVALAAFVEDRVGRGLKRRRVCANGRELEEGEEGSKSEHVELCILLDDGEDEEDEEGVVGSGCK
jgi:hypothetical protein